MIRTIIYLDVDGVINAIRNGTPSQKRTGFKDFRRVVVNGYQIQYAQELIDWLNKLAERDDLEIKWLTTWQDNAPHGLCPAIGLNGQNWEVLGGDLTDWGGVHWWKYKAIREDREKHQPRLAIWIDDDLKLETRAHSWAIETANFLAYSPDPLDGLTLENLSHITKEIEEIR